MMEPTPEHIRALVRRDVRLVAGGSLSALLAAALLVSSRLDLLADRTAATIVVVLAVVICVACLWSWFDGPPELRRDRYIVAVPPFLVAVPALVALHDLGGGPVTVMLSGAVGVSAAIAAGLALASRRA